MIVEGLCTTRNLDGATNIAPMGPVVDDALTTFLFRPFKTSTTFANLKSRRCGVFHVTDDVGLIAQAAVGKIARPPLTFTAQHVEGDVLADACRWYEFEVLSIDETRDRTEVRTRLVHTGHLRDYFGLNRAKHAVLELAILATRLHLIPAKEIHAELLRLAVPIEKTGGEQEHLAFEFLKRHIELKLG